MRITRQVVKLRTEIKKKMMIQVNNRRGRADVITAGRTIATSMASPARAPPRARAAAGQQLFRAVRVTEPAMLKAVTAAAASSQVTLSLLIIVLATASPAPPFGAASTGDADHGPWAAETQGPLANRPARCGRW